MSFKKRLIEEIMITGAMVLLAPVILIDAYKLSRKSKSQSRTD